MNKEEINAEEQTDSSIRFPLGFEEITNAADRQKMRTNKYLALHRNRTRNLYSLARYTIRQLRSTVRNINSNWRVK